MCIHAHQHTPSIRRNNRLKIIHLMKNKPSKRSFPLKSFVGYLNYFFVLTFRWDVLFPGEKKNGCSIIAAVDEKTLVDSLKPNCLVRTKQILS